jgi:FAD/FMN-containing dehydrogenase
MSRSPAANTLPIAELSAAVDGRVLLPDDAEYDRARTPFYGGIDRHPAAILRVANADDVARTVTFAREHEVELAVRSGGHSLAGHSVSEGGIVIDLAEMHALELDLDGRTAWAETGLTAGAYTVAAAEHGLATGFGDTGSVGIGGITLAGGIGFLVRKHGMTIDSLLAADVVTADGELRRVDEESHPDLFWAIRGGGGNVGVATRLRFRLHEVGTVVGGMLILPATPEVVASFIAEAEAAPDELSTIANVMPAPPMPFVAPEHHGKLVVFALMTYAGDVEAGEKAVAPFRAIATPLADMLRPMTYPEMYMPEEGEYHPIGAVHTMFVDEVGTAKAQTIIEHLEASSAMMRVTQLRVLGGAMARVPSDATAFAHRTSPIMANVAALYENPDERATHEAWVRELADVLRGEDRRAYVGFLGGEGEARVRDAYPGPTWDRLAEVKRRYDPTNLFRLNQNVPPASAGS